jgi:hypothetical protein
LSSEWLWQALNGNPKRMNGLQVGDDFGRIFGAFMGRALGNPFPVATASINFRA